MKKSIILILLISFLISKTYSTDLQNELLNAPNWIINPSKKGKICDIGSAKIDSRGISFARTKAVLLARDALAKQIETKIESLTKYEITQNQDKVKENFSSITKQTTKQILKNSKVEDIWTSPNNNLYVLVCVDKNKLRTQSTENQ